MWDDIIIGKGNKGTTSLTTLDIPGRHNIYSNFVSFWISNAVLGVGLTIFRDTREGFRLNEMISSNYPPDDIGDYIDKIVINNIPYHLFSKRMKENNKEHFKHGMDYKAAQIRDALGL